MSTAFHVAVMVYKSSSNSPNYQSLYEESITLIKAASETEAREKAKNLADERSSTFKNQNGEEISWALHKIIDISPMLEDKIGNVTEVYSRHFSNISAYNQFESLACNGEPT